MKRILLFVLCLALFACTEEPKPGKIVSIELTEENLTIIVGESGNTIAYVEMDNPANCNSTVEWSSSNESIAVAHANGDECLIEGISPGEAIITANTPEGLSATCKVTVVAKVIPVTGISLSRAWLEILENRTETLTAFLKPSDATNTKVTWSSTDESIATVNDGTVRGIKPGRAKIKAETEDGGFVAECDVTVTKDYQSQSKGPVTLKLGNVTASTVTFFGTLDVDQLGDYDMDDGGVGFIYTTTDETLNVSRAKKVRITTVGSNNEFSFTSTGLPYDTRYHYTVFLYKNGICQYGSTQYFKTEDVNINVDEVTTGTSWSTFKGTTSLLWADRSAINVGIQYSKYDSRIMTTINLSDSTETFEYKREGLAYATKYYYRTYIKQNNSYKYGNEQEFTTQPISVSIGVGNLSQTTATFSGNIDLAGGEGISVGVRYWPVSGGDTIRKSVSDIDENGNYSITVKDLKHGTQYRYSYYTYQNGSYIYGDTQEFTTEAIPVTISAGEITQTTATFKGKAELSESDAVEIGVRYSTKSTDFSSSSLSSSATEVSFKNALDGEGNFNSKETGLLHGTKYYYAYYIKQAGKYTFGTVQDFTTQTVAPNVNIASTTQTTVTFSGDVHFTEPDIFMVGIRYSTERDDFSSSYLPYTAAEFYVTDTMDANGSFTKKVNGLSYGTKYYYCYFIVQNGQYTFGDIQEFSTQLIELNINITDITQTTATFGGNVNLDNSTPIEFGILYSSSNRLTVNVSGVNKIVVTSFDNGAFSYKADKLQHSTTYYYCYYACQDGAYTYGTSKTFTTQSVTVNLSVDSVTQTTATFGGNVELTEDGLIEVGVLYSTGRTLTNGASGVTKQVLNPDELGVVSFKTEGLQHGTAYNYCYYVCQNGKYTYGIAQTFITQSVTVNLSVDSATQTTATFGGNVELTEDGLIEVGVLYSTGSTLTNGASGVTKQVLNPDESGVVSFKTEGLQHGTAYNYCYYVCQNGRYTYGIAQTFITQSVTVNLSVDSATQTTATFGGNVELTEDGLIEVGVLYSTGSTLTNDASGVTKQVLNPDESGAVSFKAEGLIFASSYNYCYYICQNGKYTYGTSHTFVTEDIENNLSVNGAANCYIVSQSGLYKIKAVKGNSETSVGSVLSAEVLWESFGTASTPQIGDLVSHATYTKSGYIGFEISSSYKEGNAVIAAKDADGNILWSWHIWLTDQPQGQVYYNNAGTMMDRNLGATSATPGDVGALGLLYQWGRKDPFLGSSTIGSSTLAKSTITWPSNVVSNSSNGTIEYATAHPTTFITDNSKNDDWYYTGDASTDNTRWTTSDKTKSIYDPCPAGWRIPDVGSNGIWSKALGSSSGYPGTYDSTNEGMNFSGNFGSASTIWYPTSGYRSGYDGSLSLVGSYGYYWSASPGSYNAYTLYFDDNGDVNPSLHRGRASGLSVRCLQESK